MKKNRLLLLAAIAASKKELRDKFVSGHVILGKVCATCFATKLRDELHEKLPSAGV